MAKKKSDGKAKRYFDLGKRIKNKTKKITSWYNSLIKNHEEKDGKGNLKPPVKPLSYFTSKIGRQKEGFVIKSSKKENKPKKN